MQLVRGKPGQFDVEVDGQVVATRGGNLLQRVLGGGWPEPADVIAKIEALQKERGVRG